MAGVRGRRERAVVVVAARGRISWKEGRRQGVLPVRVLGDMVRVIV